MLVYIFMKRQIANVGNNIEEYLLVSNSDITPSKLLSVVLVRA